MSEFDHFAKDYDEALSRGISLSGESKDYFAEGRIAWMIRRLGNVGSIRSVLDFGCGTGTSTPILQRQLKAERVIGTDTSADSLRVAANLHGESGVEFKLPAEVPDEPIFDLAFCNGVFHHIPVDDRPEALTWIRRRLRPGGRFVMWENNPLNIGTQIVMSRIPFDRDAKKITPWAARRLMQESGFRVEGTTYLFIFPSFLRFFRVLEPVLSDFPLGAQYQVISSAPKNMS